MENRKIGALWNKDTGDRHFMTGELLINGEKVKIVVFMRRKISDKEPDWDILLGREQQGLVIKK